MKRLLEIVKSNKLLAISLFGVVFIPLIYGGLYLWAFWDPYTGMKNAKIAVVNLDAGTFKDGTSYNFGEDIVDKLKEDHNLSWQFVSKEVAEKGINDTTFYAVLTIPKDFSKNVVSVDSKNPVTGKFNIKIRDTNSYFASKYIKSAITEVSKKLKKEIQKKYFDNLFANLQDIRDGLQDGSDGAWKLADGLSSASSGSESLLEGIVKFKDGFLSLKEGISKLFDGSKTLRDGVKNAYNGSDTLLKGISVLKVGTHNIATSSATLSSAVLQLSQGSSQLKSSSDQIMISLNSINTSVGTLNSGYQTFDSNLGQFQTGFNELSPTLEKILNNLNQYAVDNPSASSSAKFNESLVMLNSLNSNTSTMSASLSTLKTSSGQINATISQISQGTSALATQYSLFNNGVSNIQTNLGVLYTNTQALASGSSQLDIGMDTTISGTSSLKEGLAKLVDGSNSLSNNLENAVDGSLDLSDGISDIKNGANELNDGIYSAHNGSTKLADSIRNSSIEIALKTKESENEKQAEIMSDPIEVEESHLAQVPNNGTAFAPYFIPLSLWVGAMSIFFVLKMPINRKYKDFKKILFSLKTYGISLIVAVIQAIILPLVMTQGLNLKAINYQKLYLFSIMLSIMFVSIQYFLLRILANVGRFVGIILLMLQLTSSSGTYPVETSDNFFISISKFLPMTYAVKVLREIITGGNWNVSSYAFNMTLSMMLVSVLLCIVQSYSFPKTKKILSNLLVV